MNCCGNRARSAARRQAGKLVDRDGSNPGTRCRRVDFEVGDGSETPFQWLYARLPDAELYRKDAYIQCMGAGCRRAAMW